MILCRHCRTMVTVMPRENELDALRNHVKGNHPEEFRKLRQQLREFDDRRTIDDE